MTVILGSLFHYNNNNDDNDNDDVVGHTDYTVKTIWWYKLLVDVGGICVLWLLV